MLKVVGASWLQTRISTYILVAVALMGIGAIVLGEFGRIDNDGTYAATVAWNPKTGYKIDYWKQGNDLGKLPRRAARAYYRTRMQETGWSFVEIETSPNYPDTVQAYSAGLLEGALTWQLIHQHWQNTIEAPCQKQPAICDKIRRALKENYDSTKERANVLEADDPFWHMVRLFYTQLEGMELGWRQAVKPSKQSAEISHEDFLWLAMASDISNFGPDDQPTSERNFNVEAGGILLKYVAMGEDNVDGLIGIIHSTAAPYQKMLRLLKKYTFGYHVHPAKNSERVPTRSIVASSYPGALSSQDEYYMLYGENRGDTMIIAGTPLAPFKPDASETQGEIIVSEKQESHTVMSSARIMSSNWLCSSALSWGRYLARRRAPEDVSRPVQWILTTPQGPSIWIIEQHPTETHSIDFTTYFHTSKSLFCNGKSVFEHKQQLPKTAEAPKKIDQVPAKKFQADENLDPMDQSETLQKKNKKTEEKMENVTEKNPKAEKKFENVTEKNPKAEKKFENVTEKNPKTEKFFENVTEKNADDSEIPSTEQNFAKSNSTLNSKLIGETPGAEDVMGFRGDLGKKAVPFGNIDTKLVLLDAGGIQTFQATSGPFSGQFGGDFQWGRDFPRVPHAGQPERFNFDAVTPDWAWI